MKNFIIVTILVVILQGCSATPYQREYKGEGYSETWLTDNMFNVVFKGNELTARDRAFDFILLRSAELTLAHGFQYFSIVDARDDTKNETHVTPVVADTYYINDYNETTVYSGGHSHTRVSPVLSNTIVCLDEQIDGVFSYNAMFIYKTITEKYGINFI